MSSVDTHPATAELAKLKAELAREEASLVAAEEAAELKAAQLSYLYGEYAANVSKVQHYHEPQLRPLRAVTYAAAQKEALVRQAIDWLQATIVTQERLAQVDEYSERRDMKPKADEMLHRALQEVLRSHEEIKGCPEDALRIISHYESPPDEALATMQMAMQLRSDEDCSWSAFQVILSHNYFTNFFVPRAERMLRHQDLPDGALLVELNHFCSRPEHSVAALYQSSTPIGCLGAWLHALRDYYNVKLITAPVLLRDTSPRHVCAVRGVLEQLLWEDVISTSASTAATAQSPAVQGTEKGATRVCPGEVQARDDVRGPQGGSSSSPEGQDTTAAVYTPPTAAANQHTVFYLQQRLHMIEDASRAAREEMKAIQARMAAEIKELQRSYDDAMLPIHAQFEAQTSEFIRMITRDGGALEDVADKIPSAQAE